MCDLGMELESEPLVFVVFDRCEVGVFGGGDGLEALRELSQFVTMGVPDLQVRGEFSEQRAAGIAHGKSALAILALQPFFHFPSVELCQQLHPIADSQDGHTQVEDPSIRQGCLGGVNARWPARQNDPLGLHSCQCGRWSVVAQDDRVDVALADTTRDHLSVLGSEIENDDLLVH